MLTHKIRRRGPHGVCVKVVLNLPDQPLVVSGGGAAHQKAKEITALDGRKSRMPVRRYLCAGENCNGRGLQMMVQRLGQAEGFPSLAKVTMRHLPQRMHTRVRASGSGDDMRPRLELCESRFDSLLYGRPIRLSLPARKWRAMILDFQCISGHASAIARARPSDNP